MGKLHRNWVTSPLATTRPQQSANQPTATMFSHMSVHPNFPQRTCLESWQRHRSRCRWSWGLLAGWIPFGMALIKTADALRLPTPIFIACGGAYIVALMGVSFSVNLFRCPRCGHRFYAWGPFGLGHNSFARKCRNCGLRKWKCE